jgi:hypothetical protein
MERNEHNPAHTIERTGPLSGKALRVRFSDAGSAALRSYRAQLSDKSGTFVSLADALETLIKSHPFVTGAVVK